MIHAYCAVFFFQLLSLSGASESGIVGGKVVKAHSMPFMASLQFVETHSCGGMLIREDFVLTAAHCYKQDYEMMVVLGAHDIGKKSKEESQQRIEVAKYIKHPKFKPEGHDYDIMLLKLKTKATLNKYVKTIALPKKEKKYRANINCTVAGWGRTAHKNKDASNVLKEATEQLQFSFECKNRWQEYFHSEHMLCTKFKKNTGGVCQGDSGGPLICKDKLIGLTAFTYKCDCNDPAHPHVFTKIGFFLTWIDENMK